MTIAADRQPPHDIDAEQSVLGSVFIAPRLWPLVASQLPGDAFFLPAHREVYDAMAAVAARQQPLDPITVGAEIKARGALGRLEGGEEYLHALPHQVPTAENIEAYVRIVRRTANLREMIRLCAETASRAYGGDVDDEHLAEQHAQQLSRVFLRDAGALVRLGDGMPELLEEIEHRGDQGGISGVRTGIDALDTLTCGFLPEELIILGADPGSGKSALAVQAGLHLCIDEGGTCFDGSLEMPKKMIAERALAYLAEINSYNLRRGHLSLDDFRELHRAGGLLQTLDFYVEGHATTVREFGAQARVWRSRHPGKKALGVFDFLQLAAATNGSNGSRAQQVGNDARELKLLARELKIPIIAVSSLSRTQRDAAERPPRMTDVKESGDIEYAADFVILIWNRDGTKDGPVTLVMAKNRNSPAGEHIQAHWIGRHYRFCDVGHDGQSSQMPLSA